MTASVYALCSRRVVTPAGVRPAAVVVRGERIERVCEAGELDPGVPVEDLGELVLMPGLVDSHVHVNEPGRTEWEGFETATRAAAAGGVTTVVDMPLNCIPVTTTVAALHEKLAACAPRLYVDTGFWAGVVPDNAAELRGLVDAGVLGAKAFLVHSGIDDFPATPPDRLRAAMRILAPTGVPLLVHAELDQPIPASSEAPNRYARYLGSRPRAMEDAAVTLMVELCRETRCRVHIVHLSSASALPILAAARAEGLPITVETCPHYLCLTAEEVPDGATAFKCAPPIREATNRDGLWRGLADGVIDLVVSDHSPCTPELKLFERGDFLEAWGGIASLQLGLANVWTEARKRGFGLAELSRWMSRAPAELAGLSASKGSLAAGHDADLIAWDPDARRTVTASLIQHRHKVTPYLGREVQGVVQRTWLRGAPVYTDGAVANAARGRALLRPGGRPA